MRSLNWRGENRWINFNIFFFKETKRRVNPRVPASVAISNPFGASFCHLSNQKPLLRKSDGDDGRRSSGERKGSYIQRYKAILLWLLWNLQIQEVSYHFSCPHPSRGPSFNLSFCFSSSWLIVAAFTGRTFFYIYRNQDCAFLFIKEKRFGFDLLLIVLILLIIFIGFGFFSRFFGFFYLYLICH